MSIFTDLFNTVLEKRGYTKNPDLVSAPGFPFIHANAKTEEFVRHYTGWVYAMVKRRAEQMSNIPIKLMRQQGEDAVEVVDHQAVELLDKVNPYMSGRELRELTFIHADLSGESFWNVDRGKTALSEPQSIIPLLPHRMKIKPGTDTLIEEYLYTVNSAKGAQEVHLKPSEVFFFKEVDPNNFYRGLSIIRSAALTIDNDDAMEQWSFNFFRHGASMGTAFTTDQKLNQDQVERIYEKMKQTMTGVENARKPMLLHSGLKFAGNTGAMQKDMEFLEGQKWTRDKMMAMFGITKVILGITEDVNRANAETAEYVFAKYMIVPRVQKFVDALNEFYLPMFKNSQNLFFMIDDPTPPNAAEDAEVFSKALAGASYMTPNEVRAQKGLEPIENGDSLFIPSSLTAVDAPTPSAPEKSIYNPRQRQVYRKEMKRKAILDKAKKQIEEKASDLVKTIASSDDSTKTFRERAESKNGFHDKLKAYETALTPDFKHEIQRFFDEYEASVLSLVQGNFLNTKTWEAKDPINRFLPSREEIKTLGIEIVTPLITNILQERGNEALFFIGSHIGFKLDNPRAEKFIESHAAELIYDIDTTTRDSLRKALREGVNAGEGIPSIQQRVKAVMGQAKDYRAEMIARTEVINASNFASQEAWKQSGVVEGKEWLTAVDERVDDECAALDGHIVPINAKFESNTPVPPLHPNCRCTIIPVLEMEKSVKEAYEKQQKKKSDNKRKKIYASRVEERIKRAQELLNL